MHVRVGLKARPSFLRSWAWIHLAVDDYVEKPFGIGELTAYIRKALRHRGRRDAIPVVTEID